MDTFNCGCKFFVEYIGIVANALIEVTHMYEKAWVVVRRFVRECFRYILGGHTEYLGKF